ncbi:hypothetical protein [Prescottella equi]
MKIVKYAVIGVVVLGIFRGYVNWADTEGVDSSNVIRVFETSVNTIADLTYRWIPVVINTVTGGGSTGGAQTPAANAAALVGGGASW